VSIAPNTFISILQKILYSLVSTFKKNLLIVQCQKAIAMGGVTVDGGGNLAQIVFLASIIAAGTDPRISVTELKPGKNCPLWTPPQNPEPT
jgi:hypothetical protein